MNYCYSSTDELAEQLSLRFLDYLSEGSKSGHTLNIALSGGNTPRSFFKRAAINQYRQKPVVPWHNIHFFWVDERCVPPDHEESNFGMFRSAFFKEIEMDESNIHRIRGENNPDREALRYSQEIKRLVPLKDNIPLFDLIFLGVGDDGHTASIFPDRTDLLDAEKIYETIKHPLTGQFRITLTGRSILQAKKIIFLVTGKAKSTVVRQIMDREPGSLRYPAAYIFHKRQDADWYMDRDAAKFLTSSDQ